MPYYHVVFTLPALTAAIAFQKQACGLRHPSGTAAQAMRDIGADPRHLGAEISARAVLHTCNAGDGRLGSVVAWPGGQTRRERPAQLHTRV